MPMRLATFNLENLDLPPRAALPLDARAEVLRPELERLDADILCLQEVNGQHVPGRPERVLAALDQLLVGTRYARYARAATAAAAGPGVADVHNLVTLSRFPILRSREIRHELVPPISAAQVTAQPPVQETMPVHFDRPLLVTEHAIGDASLTVINLHLRAPLASSIPGQKNTAHIWKSVAGWAEGYYLSGLKRSGQALELRLLADRLLEENPDLLLAVAGDFNAEDHETPVRIAAGAVDDTGNEALMPHALIVLDRAIEAGRRWSLLHQGRAQMLDHILASRALYERFQSVEARNEALRDEAEDEAKGFAAAGSHHAALVAAFAL